MGLFGNKKNKKKKTQKIKQHKFDFLGLDDELNEDEYYEDEDGEYYEDEDGEYYEDEDGEYYQDEDDEYYEPEDGEYYEDSEEDAYYEEDGTEKAAFMESDRYADDESYYEEEADAEYIAGDGEYAVEGQYEDDGVYYEEEDYDDIEPGEEDLYYVDDEYDEYDDYDDEDEGVDFYELKNKMKKRKGKIIPLALSKFKKLSTIDKIITVTGAAVLCICILTGAIVMGVRSTNQALASFAEVGAELENVTVIGESGLVAVSSAQASKVAQILEETPVVEEVTGGNVGMKLTTIVKDLKIKFINPETDKLIANIPFEVEVTTPNKKTEVWTDDDKDGVIYKEEIAAGTYKVKLVDISAQYPDYNFNSGTESIDVLATIAYKKVDVADEIKTEAQINAAVEDTAITELVEESKLTDTVPFVASSTTAGAVSYTAVPKGNIKDPGASAKLNLRSFYLMAKENSITISETAKTLKVGESANLTASAVVYENEIDSSISANDQESNKVEKADPIIDWKSDNTSVATVDGGKVTAVAKGTAKITVTSKSGQSAECTVTVTQDESLSLDKTTLSVAVGANASITAATKPENATISSAVSADTKIATVSVSGKTITVKGVAAGTVKVTVTDSNGKTAECAITVTANDSLKLSADTLTVAVGKTGTLTATLTPDTATISKTDSSSTANATVKHDGKTITVTGLKAGTATITVTSSNGKTAICKVTVSNSAETDTTSLLKDKDGKQVYVQDNGNYRQAVYADYYKYKEFYLQTTEPLYTGWQTLNGKTYYFLADHKYVTGEQVIQGAKYTFASDGTMVTSSGTMGIDVSKWNGNIDWNKVKSSGVSYVIIRVGYRGSSTGALIDDPKFAANISGATAAGLKVGVYFFTQAVNEKEAVEEASMVISRISKYKISYPVFLDVESSGGRADGIDKGTRTAVCKAFCQTIQNSGYTAGVYANKTWLNSKIDAGSLGSYKIWLAQYAAKPTYTGRYNLWQYSSKGSINGISGNVDLNISYLGY